MVFHLPEIVSGASDLVDETEQVLKKAFYRGTLSKTTRNEIIKFNIAKKY